MPARPVGRILARPESDERARLARDLRRRRPLDPQTRAPARPARTHHRLVRQVPALSEGRGLAPEVPFVARPVPFVVVRIKKRTGTWRLSPPLVAKSLQHDCLRRGLKPGQAANASPCLCLRRWTEKWLAAPGASRRKLLRFAGLTTTSTRSYGDWPCGPVPIFAVKVKKRTGRATNGT